VAKPFSKFWQKQSSKRKKEKNKEYAREYFILIFSFCAKKRKEKGDYLLLGLLPAPKITQHCSTFALICGPIWTNQVVV
jgi:hypothetical protein